MITIELAGRTIRVNQSKLRANLDSWHGVNIPGLEGRDLVPSEGRDLVPSKDVLASDEGRAGRPG
eukprot:4763-Prorocentrum_lima.AAC.1